MPEPTSPEATYSASTDIAQAGAEAATIYATFSPQFLALLSEHLYSSPNKAFEELISNSWDAHATQVYVRIPENLQISNSAIWILDNGTSMNVDGFTQLWSIANSAKREGIPNGRKQIGKFGIGKLATYVLANELTYICRSADGKIRVVTMDYRKIDEAKAHHIDKVPLTVRELASITELRVLLEKYENGDEIANLIDQGIPNGGASVNEDDEFGGSEVSFTKAASDTWTLAILTTLKAEGQKLSESWIRRLLSTALPLGNTIHIDLNGEDIKASKSKKPIQKSWVIGPDLDFDEFPLDNETVVKISKHTKPYPHITIDGLGEITGKATLYESNIRGGKSDQISDSNGFFVNVLGRVINPEDNLFKLSDLNLSVLAQFRATIRVDGLDKQISANREAIAESQELKTVRAFLRKLFNLARREFQKVDEKVFAEAAKGQKDDFGSVPVAPLNNLILRAFDNDEAFPPIVKGDDAELRKEKESWLNDTKEDLSKSISKVEFRDELPENSLVKYDLKSRTIVINKNHPFTKENTHTTEQIDTLKDTAIVDLLTDAYILNCGISADLFTDITQHRDRVMRLVAQIRRNSAAQIISTLSNWNNDARPFEHIVGDALEYLGFSVDRYGKPGEPEGFATAFQSPSLDEQRSTYTLTYDAKSTKHSRAKTGNVNMAGLARHKRDFNANYALVVAPDFQVGALEKEAEDNKVAPMTAKCLAKLVSITVGYGPISLEKLREVFNLYSPKKIDEWTVSLQTEMQNKTNVDIATLVKALELLVTKNRMDILGCDSIAQKYREIIGSESRPTRADIASVFRGLSLIAPNAVFIDPTKGFDVFIFTHPSMLMKEIKRQTQNIPEELKIGSISD